MRRSTRQPPQSKIVEFRSDAAGQWIAELACGHSQHVWHKPPFQQVPWVTSAAERARRIGASLPCPLCLMPKLPSGLTEYKRTAEFAEETVPEGLTRSHQLKADVWGEIVVTAGHVVYVLEDHAELSFVLHPDQPGVIAPGCLHRVEPKPQARFFVRFLR